MTENKRLSQLPLEFAAQNLMRREDFMVSKCNSEAYQMIVSWPNWLTSGMVIYGPKGCGKTHLAHIFADIVMANGEKPVHVGLVPAESVNMRNIKRLSEENASIVIENLSPKADEEALFHLCNIYNTPERYVLWTADMPPSRMRFGLKDLHSRLNMLPCIEIKEPDDIMLRTLIAKLFNDRQLVVGEDILNYIMNNARRSFAYIRSLVEEADYISLVRKVPINYGVIKEAMERLSDDNTCEPDLFADEIL